VLISTAQSIAALLNWDKSAENGVSHSLQEQRSEAA
jgi:hypothetical protein